jgi:hypothetical protein
MTITTMTITSRNNTERRNKVLGAAIGFLVSLPIVGSLALSWAGKALAVGGSSLAGYVLSKGRR